MKGFCDIVTGATSGIGERVAKLLLARGSGLVAVARDAGRLEAMYGLDKSVDTVALDLSDAGAASALAGKIGLPVRYFVHCAGFAVPAPLGFIDGADALRMYSAHALFPMLFLGWMARRANHADGAAAVLVSSRSAREADRGNAAYAAAKGAVEGLFHTAASELAVRGVALKLIAPGPVDTRMARETWMRNATDGEVARMLAAGELATPEKIAGDILELLEGGR